MFSDKEIRDILDESFSEIDSLSEREILGKIFSKYKDKTRGNGLIAFKKFIEEISKQYESYLEISTENKLYLSNNDKIKTLNDKIKGTFIRWVIKGI